MEHSSGMKNRSTTPSISTPVLYSPTHTDSTLSSLETKHSSSPWKQANKDIDPSFSLVCKEFEDLISNSLSSSRSNKRENSLKIEEMPVKRVTATSSKSDEAPKSPIYIEDHLNKLPAMPPISRIEPDEEEIIARSYGKFLPRSSSLEEESKQKQTDDERSLLSTSAFNDSPRIYHYSESSANESPGIDSPLAGSGAIIFADKAGEMKLASIGEMSFGKNLSMESISKKAGENVEVLQLQVQHLSNIIERLEGELQRRFQTMQGDMLTFSEQLSQNKVEFAGLKHLRQIEDSTLRNFEQRITKSEQSSNESYKILETILREISDRVELLEKKEEGKIKLFEELGYDIESAREDYKALSAKIDNMQKEFLEKIDYLKHEMVTPSQIELLTSAHRKEIAVIWNEIGKCNEKLNSSVEDLDRIRSQQYDTQINIIKKDLDSLRASLSLKYDSLPGMIEEKMRESSRMILDVQNRVDKIEANSLQDSEVNAAVRAFKSFETRLNQVETKAIKASQHDLSETQKLLKKENVIVSKLEDRISEIEKEAKSMKSLKRKLAHMIRNFNATEKDVDMPLNISDLRKKPVISAPSMQVQLETTKEEEATPDPHSFASTPVYRSTIKSAPKILEEEFQDQPYRISTQQVIFIQSDPPSNLEDKLSYMEKINIHKKAMESITPKSPMQSILSPPNLDLPPSQLDLRGFLPGEAESVVISAILDKANRTRVSDNFRMSYGSNFKPLSPLSCSFSNLARYSEKGPYTSPPPTKPKDPIPTGPSPFQPSDELKEHLKLKGFKIKDNKPILRY